MRETCKDTTSSEGMSCLDWNVQKNHGIYFKQLEEELPPEKFESFENLGTKPYKPVLL